MPNHPAEHRAEKISSTTFDNSSEQLTRDYLAIAEAKGLAPKTVVKYRADLAKLRSFCEAHRIGYARQFSENDLYLYRRHLVKSAYADKTIQGAIVLAKQVFKWAWRQKLVPDYKLEAASFAKAKAGTQPCFTTEQVDLLIEKAEGEEKLAFAIMAYAGLRIGEVEQLRWLDIVAKDNVYVMIHVRRGGSNGTTKDRDDRFVPVYPSVVFAK